MGQVKKEQASSNLFDNACSRMVDIELPVTSRHAAKVVHKYVEACDSIVVMISGPPVSTDYEAVDL